MDELKKQAEELGVKVHGNWGEARLQAEIDKALDAPALEAAGDKADAVDVVEAAPEAVEQEQEQDSHALDQRAPVIKNLQANPNKRLGLAGFGSIQLTEAQQQQIIAMQE